MTLKNYAIVFPGQGSQTPGMLSNISDEYPQIKETFDEASAALGYDLWDIVQNNPDDKLNQTEFTQPALLTASVALWRVLNNKKALTPTFLAGHSLGEYSALVCAGSFTFEAAVKIVSQRGQFMQEAVPSGVGAMAAIIGLENEKIDTLCHQAANGDVLTPANYNAIGQTVVAGNASAVDRVIELAKESGAKIAKRIPVSVPSHCALMAPAGEKLADKLKDADIKHAKIRVIHNVDVLFHDNPEEISQALTAQLNHPVRWVETIEKLITNGVTDIIECGPGKVLAGLIKRIDKTLNTYTLNTAEDINALLENLS